MDQVFKNNLVLILIWYLQCYSFSPIVQKNKGIFQVFVVGDAYYWTEISRDQKLLLIFFPVGNLQKKTKKPSAKVFCSKKTLKIGYYFEKNQSLWDLASPLSQLKL